jgi:hypothetical protein
MAVRPQHVSGRGSLQFVRGAWGWTHCLLAGVTTPRYWCLPHPQCRRWTPGYWRPALRGSAGSHPMEPHTARVRLKAAGEAL